MAYMISNNFADLLDPAFRKIIEDGQRKYKSFYKQLFNIDKSDRAIEKDSAVTGFGRFPERAANTIGDYDDAYQAYDTTYTHKEYSLKFRIGRTLWEDDLFGVMARMPKALFRAAMASYELDHAKVFDYAFTALGSIPSASKWISGSDGVALCSASHPSAAGGALRSNVANPAADLSVSSLKAALINLDTAKDDRELPIVMTPKILLVHPNDRFTAVELLKSVNLPGTGNNDINSLRTEYNLELVVNPYLTDTDAWFVLCEEHELKSYDRVAFSMNQTTDFEDDAAKWSGRMRYSAGWSHWLGVYGSAGA